MLIANVPTGNRDPKRSAAKTPTTYRSIAPNAPPIATNRYRLNFTFLLLFLYNNTWAQPVSADTGANRLVDATGSLDDVVRLCVGIRATVTDVIRNSPAKASLCIPCLNCRWGRRNGQILSKAIPARSHHPYSRKYQNMAVGVNSITLGLLE